MIKLIPLLSIWETLNGSVLFVGISLKLSQICISTLMLNTFLLSQFIVNTVINDVPLKMPYSLMYQDTINPTKLSLNKDILRYVVLLI